MYDMINIINSLINQELRQQNFTKGRIAELKWMSILKKQYPTIKDRNIKNPFSKMDAISKDNNIKIEHEHKNRDTIKHDQYRGLMVNQCKIDYSVKRLKKGIRQIYYWTCSDGLYYWELTDITKQKNELIYYRNGNLQTNEGHRDVVDIKKKYLKKYIEK